MVPNPATGPRHRGFLFDVGPGVPDHDLDLIKSGLALLGDYLESDLGGDIPLARRQEVTVKVVATGRGNEEPDGGGSCCTGMSMEADPPGSMRPFFDVKHPHWLNQGWERRWSADAVHEKTAGHEYTHGWQNTLGCLSSTSQPLGKWINEGIAEQVAYAAMIQRGEFTKAEVLEFAEMAAKSGDGSEWNIPLALQADGGGAVSTWPGDIGYLALELAMDGAGDLSDLRDICVAIAGGATREQAFESVFDIPLDQFYTEFEAWKATRP